MDIREDTDKGLVFINGLAISAFIDENTCPRCQQSKLYSYDYDAFFCIHCDEWLEKPCQDPNCRHCPKRPAKPSILLETPEDPDDPKFIRTEEQPASTQEHLDLDIEIVEAPSNSDLDDFIEIS